MKKFISIIKGLSMVRKVAICGILALTITGGVVGTQAAKKAEAVSVQKVRASAEKEANNKIRKEIEKMLSSSSLSEDEKKAFWDSSKKAKDGASLLALKDSINEANAKKAAESSVTPQQEVAAAQQAEAEKAEAEKQAEDAQQESQAKVTQSTTAPAKSPAKSQQTAPAQTSQPAQQPAQQAPAQQAPAQQTPAQQTDGVNTTDEEAFWAGMSDIMTPLD